MSVAFKQTVEITSVSEEIATAWAVNYLTSKGYSIAAPDQGWEPLGQFMKRVGITSHESFHRHKRSWEGRGETLQLVRGPKGTIRDIHSSPDFDKFATRNTAARLTTAPLNGKEKAHGRIAKKERSGKKNPASATSPAS